LGKASRGLFDWTAAPALLTKRAKAMTDYYDRWISDLERLAEERSQAIAALQAGEDDARELVQQWSKTLASIRQLKEHGRKSQGAGSSYKSLSHGA